MRPLQCRTFCTVCTGHRHADHVSSTSVSYISSTPVFPDSLHPSRDGFCINILDTPLCPLNVVTNLQEAVWDADVVINGLPSTETRMVFRQIGQFWKERRRPPAVIISLAKGVEAEVDPEPHIVTPSLMIHQESE